MENKNIIKNVNLNIGNKNFRYNDLLINNKKAYSSKAKKRSINSSSKFQNALNNLREGLAELSNEYLINESPDNNISNISLRKLNYSLPKNKYLRTKKIIRKVDYPSSNNNMNLSYINKSHTINNSYLSNITDFSKENKGGLSKRFRPSYTQVNRRTESDYSDIISLEKTNNSSLE